MEFQNTSTTSEKQVAELRSMNETLEIDVATMHNRQLGDFKSNEDKLQPEIAKLRAQNVVLNANVDAMRSQLVKSSSNEKKLEIELAGFRAQSSEHLHDADQLRQQIAESKQKSKQLETEINSLRTQDPAHQHDANQLRQQLAESNWRNQQLQTTVTSLLKSQQAKEPLVEIGTAIRLRYLEQTKGTVLGVGQNGLNPQVIRAGNAAAHHANGRADAAVFESGLVVNLHTFLGVFSELYECTPERWSQLPAKIQVMLNCKATVQSLEVISRNRAIGERQQLFDHIDVIRQKCRSMTRVEFEADGDVVRRLHAVKAMVEEIVQADRDRNGGLEGVTRRSSQY